MAARMPRVIHALGAISSARKTWQSSSRPIPYRAFICDHNTLRVARLLSHHDQLPSATLSHWTGSIIWWAMEGLETRLTILMCSRPDRDRLSGHTLLRAVESKPWINQTYTNLDIASIRQSCHKLTSRIIAQLTILTKTPSMWTTTRRRRRFKTSMTVAQALTHAGLI